MKLDVDKEVALLQRMTVGQLRERFEETWGEPTNNRNKQWLVKRIAWKMQANIEGDISERARRRAAELARGTDIRTTAPKATKPVTNPVADTVTGCPCYYQWNGIGWVPVSVLDPCVEQNGPFEAVCVCAGNQPTGQGSYIGQIVYTGCEQGVI